MRTIDADALIIDLLDRGIEGVQTDDYAEFRQIVEDAPTVDAVAVVRCKDCKYAAPNGKYGCSCYHFKKYETHEMTSNDYCSHGERKGGENDYH